MTDTSENEFDKEANRLAREWAAKYSVEIQGVGVTAYCDLVSGIVTALRNERERAAKIADKWANARSCTMHDNDPCCHIRTGAAVAAAIRNPKGE